MHTMNTMHNDMVGKSLTSVDERLALMNAKSLSGVDERLALMNAWR